MRTGWGFGSNLYFLLHTVALVSAPPPPHTHPLERTSKSWLGAPPFTAAGYSIVRANPDLFNPCPVDGLVGHLKDFCLNLKSHRKPLKCVKWGVAGAIYIFKRSFWPLSRDPGSGEHRAGAGRPAKRITVGSPPVRGAGGLPGQGVQECEKGVGYSERVM